jgi:hypothetical protein
MIKGKNGTQKGADNLSAVSAWIAERNARLDWHEYAYNNRINRSALAEELDFSKSVCTQNSAVRMMLDAADAIWFANEAIDRVSHEAARERAQTQSSRVSSDNNALQKRLAELETENRHLRQELNAFKQQQALILGGVSGFKL